jgi:putative hydrolase of the HAD superfamily
MIIFRPCSPPKALTFDLDDTLYDNYPAIKRAEQCLAEAMRQRFPRAAKVSSEQLIQIKRNFILKEPSLAWDMGQLRLKTLRHLVSLDTHDNIEQAAQDLFALFYRERSKVSIHSDTIAVLETLSKQLPLVGITNGNVNAKQAGFDHVFTQIIHANIDNPAKPDSSMFKQAASVLALPSYSILHVGDSLINDVYGAYCAGFNSAWYAINRTMNMNKEKVSVLPNFQLSNLNELLLLL